MALVYIRPDADTDDGDWVNASGNNTNLYDSVNESVASDSDYIRSGNNPVNDIVKLRLGDFASVPAEPMTVRYRFKKVVSAGEVLSLKVRLVEGDAPGTTIAEWEHDGVSDTYTDGEQELTSGQFALVSDFDDLYLEFEAISGALEVIEPGPLDGSYLLIDEDEGFAINAMYPGDLGDAAYVGAPIGGSVAVIDTGTPANDLDDVPLDSSNLTQAGTSAKLVHWHEAPYVRWTPHNLALQSQTFNSWTTNNASVSADSTTAPDGTSTADTVTASAGSNTHFIYYNSLSGLAGVQYTLSVYAKTNTTQYFQLSMASASGSDWLAVVADLNGGIITQATAGAAATLIGSGITSVGNGWYRITVTGIINTSTRYPVVEIVNSGTPTQSVGGDVTWNPAGTESVYVWGYQINRGPIALPYLVTTSAARIGIPQSYDINEDMFGVLVEPAATNACLRSEEFSDGSWGAITGATTTTSATTAPDGTSTADMIVETTDNSSHQIAQPVTIASGIKTFSVYAKYAGRDWVTINVYDSGDNRTYFNLSTGAVGTTDGDHTPSIQNVGNGWYRLIVVTNTAANPYFSLGTASADGSASFTGNASLGMYVWGAQLETGSVATSYIPTISSTVTRAVDKVSVLTSLIPYSAVEWTLYGAWKARVIEPSRHLFLIQLTGNDKVYSRLDYTLNVYSVYAGGVSQVATLGDNVTANILEEQTFGVQEDNYGITTNGASVTLDDDAALPAAATVFWIGSDSGDEALGGWIYKIVYVPRRVSNSEIVDWRYAF